jgi:hypothetical protein
MSLFTRAARLLRDSPYRYEKQLDGPTCINTYYAILIHSEPPHLPLGRLGSLHERTEA